MSRAPGRWFDAHVDFVSLVKRPANKRTLFFAKSRAEDDELFLPFIKRAAELDDGTHFVSSIVYEPDTDDTDGQSMSAEEIEKAAYEFMMNKRAIDLEHSMQQAEGVEIVESYICKSDMMLEGQPVKRGSWIMTLGIRNPDVWDGVLTGKYNGFSMYGHGKLLRKSEEPEPGFVGRIARWFADRFSKNKTTPTENPEPIFKADQSNPTNERSGDNMANALTEKQFEDVFEASFQACKKAMHDEMLGQFRKAGGIVAAAEPPAPDGGGRTETEAIVKSVMNEMLEEVKAERAKAEQEAELKKAEAEKEAQNAEAFRNMVREMMQPQMEELKKSFRAPSNLNDVEEIKKGKKQHYLHGIL